MDKIKYGLTPEDELKKESICSFRLDTDLLKRLESEAKNIGTSKSKILRSILINEFY